MKPNYHLCLQSPGIGRWLWPLAAILGATLSLSLGLPLRAIAATAPATPANGSATTTPDLHTFTNGQGKSFQGTIISVTDDTVNLKRDDGQSFKSKISIFNNADQSYIADWVVKQAATQGTPVFQIFATPSRTNPVPTKPAPEHSTASDWTEGYTLQLKNESVMHWTDLTVRYVILKLEEVPGQLPPDDIVKQHLSGSLTVDDFPCGEEKDLSTEKIALHQQAFEANNFWANGASPKSTDQIQGIWVRVYDHDNHLLQEWVTPVDLTKTYSWDNLVPSGSAARVGKPPAKPRGTGAKSPSGLTPPSPTPNG
jgi:hypothetical protein